jgi:hypothetical protein
MSFGFSIGDLAALVSLTKSTYDGWRDAPREYEDVVEVLGGSNTLLYHVERRFETLTGTETNAGKQKEVGELLRSCERAISELRSVVKRRRKLGHWDRIRLGSGASHVSDCKNRLARHISILTPFLFSLELESIGKDISSLPATLDRLPQMLSNALPAALGKMIDQRIEDSRTARGSIMTTHGDDDDKQAYRELRRNLRLFGVKDSVVRQQRTKLVEFIRTLARDDHDTIIDHQLSEKQTYPSPVAPTPVSQVEHATEEAETMCANVASKTSYRRFQAYAETEDEDETTESAVVDSSDDNMTTRPEMNPRNMGDYEHCTHVAGNTKEGVRNEPEATKNANITPSRHESTKGAPGRRRKYQAYVESEDEDATSELASRTHNTSTKRTHRTTSPHLPSTPKSNTHPSTPPKKASSQSSSTSPPASPSRSKEAGPPNSMIDSLPVALGGNMFLPSLTRSTTCCPTAFMGFLARRCYRIAGVGVRLFIGRRSCRGGIRGLWMG